MEFSAAIPGQGLGMTEMINAIATQPQVYTVPAYGGLEAYGQFPQYVTHVAPGAYIATTAPPHPQHLIAHRPSVQERLEFAPPTYPTPTTHKEWRRDDRNRERDRERGGRDRERERDRNNGERYRDRERDQRSSSSYREHDRERDREKYTRGGGESSSSIPSVPFYSSSREPQHYRRKSDREYRDRDRDYHHDRDRDRGSGSRIRRGRSRERSRSRSVTPSRSRSRSQDRERNIKIGGEEEEMSVPDFRKAIPNNTIMVRGLAQHITENDILSDIMACKLSVKDIRLVRKKLSGISRGFAFVEFSEIHDAINWMEQKQGVLILQDVYRAMLQYSNPKEVDKWSRDWYCVNCSAHNFKKRDTCFKCSTARQDFDAVSESDDACTYPTNTLILRGLDALSTEEGVLLAIQDVAGDLPIRAVRLSRDPLTKLSWGICYLEMNSVLDSMHLFRKFEENPPVVDGKTITVVYCKTNKDGAQGQKDNSSKSEISNSGNFAQGSSLQFQPQQPQPLEYTAGADISQLAEYSASLYASTPEEMAAYRQYYNSYYQQQADAMSNATQSDSVNAAAAVAQSALKAKQEKKKGSASTIVARNSNSSSVVGPTESNYPGAVIPGVPINGEYPKFSPPDVSTYVYEETSGYYYDSSTGLYYDGNTRYYYESRFQRYLYWDSEQSTYLPAPTDGRDNSYGTVEGPGVDGVYSTGAHAGGDLTDKKDKQDKVKVAKKIAKDMERWAKAQNKRNEIPKGIGGGTMVDPSSISSGAPPPANSHTPSITADTGFSILLERRGDRTTPSYSSPLDTNKKASGLVAAYGGYGSDESDDEKDRRNSRGAGHQQSQKMSSSMANPSSLGAGTSLVNQGGGANEKPTCMLCKRQFPSKEVLTKHIQFSALHKTNLENLMKNASGGEVDLVESEDVMGSSVTAPSPSSLQYRDRAKERRLKYGKDSVPANRGGRLPSSKSEDDRVQRSDRLNMFKQEAAPPPPPANQPPSENVGSRMLKKMGWSEGMGLGRDASAPTPVIEAERRATSAGLGVQGAACGVAGDSYKDSVKRKMMYRYQERDHMGDFSS